MEIKVSIDRSDLDAIVEAIGYMTDEIAYLRQVLEEIKEIADGQILSDPEVH